MLINFTRRSLKWIVAAVVVVAVSLGLVLYFVLREKPSQTAGAVVANGFECANIGRNILQKGGSAVDSAIATLFCDGVACPQSMGLGGGFFATVYIKSTREIVSLIAREGAPLKATEDMFVNQTEITGALSAAVPGELRGYWALHQKYGKLPWKELVQPAIDLCKFGHRVTIYLDRALRKFAKNIMETPSLREVFLNPVTGVLYRVGETIRQPKLAETLQQIANEGEKAMYDGGSIGKNFVKDVQKFGGIIEEKDFYDYKVRWTKPVVSKLPKGYSLYTTPLPSSGHILTFIMNLVNELNTTDEKLFWHRIVESFKHAYGARTNLGDNVFVPGIDELLVNLTNVNYAKDIVKLIKDDRTFESFKYYGADFYTPDNKGTANMAVLAPNGDAITVTSTINGIFGAKLRSESTGIILNNEMDDFSTPGKINDFGIPPSPANFIVPKKMPMSSMCPSIILDKSGNVKLLIGSAGGSKITTAVALTIIRHLIMNQSLFTSVQSERLHHQLAPMVVEHELNFDKDILKYLELKGHKLKEVPVEEGFSAVTAIGVVNGKLEPVYDRRRNGSLAVYNP